MITLEATKRIETGKAVAALYSQDKMPAVVYGPKKDSESITVSLHEFKAILRNEGSAAVIELTGLGTPLQVLIHDISRDPVTTEPRHADFYAIEKGAKAQVAVPITFVGDAMALKVGGNLVKIMHELVVEADPAKLPQEVEVDLSVLAAIGDQIHVKDVKLPAGVVAMADPEDVIVLAQEGTEEPEEDTAAPDMAAIEVEKKGKDEESAEEGA